MAVVMVVGGGWNAYSCILEIMNCTCLVISIDESRYEPTGAVSLSRVSTHSWHSFHSSPANMDDISGKCLLDRGRFRYIVFVVCVAPVDRILGVIYLAVIDNPKKKTIVFDNVDFR